MGAGSCPDYRKHYQGTAGNGQFPGEELGSYAAEGITEQMGKKRNSFRDQKRREAGIQIFHWALNSMAAWAACCPLPGGDHRHLLPSFHLGKVSTLLSPWKVCSSCFYPVCYSEQAHLNHSIISERILPYSTVFCLPSCSGFVGATTPISDHWFGTRSPCLSPHRPFLIQDRAGNKRTAPGLRRLRISEGLF